MVQIDLLDVSIKEPYSKPTNNPKRRNYQCSDRLILTEQNTKMLTLCGEVNTNLIEYRTKSNVITLDFKAEEFSPTRGLLFRYSCNQSIVSINLPNYDIFVSFITSELIISYSYLSLNLFLAKFTKIISY